MSIQDDDKLTPDEASGNAALRRALAHAPDHATAPDWRIRRAIQQKAREALAPPSVESALGLPWWKRLWAATGSRSTGNRMPWNAAFATVVLAVLVTLLWQREPVPSAQLDGEAQVAASAVAPPAPAPAPEAADRTAEPSPAAANKSAAATNEAASTPAQAPATPSPAPKERESRKLESTDEVPRQMAPLAAESSAPSPVAPAAPAAPVPAARSALPSPVPPVSSGALDSQGADRARLQAESSDRLAPAPDASAKALAPAAPAAAARAPAPSTERTDATDPPTFAALSQWNRLTIAQSGGGTRSVSRAGAGELAPLMGSAAISAVEARRLSGRVEWRLTLERDGKVLAVLELAHDQVRWREGNAPSATGVPSAGALAALRRALGDVAPPPAAAVEPAVPTPPSEPAEEPAR